jgi:poly-gamma-glutamate capsule biosynthesis protein CapA/YwtB (metallophosphatase superfamily)
MHVLSFDKFSKGTYKIAFLGDIMCENRALLSVVNADPFIYLKQWLYTTDFVVGNLETTFSGETSDYPKFSSNDLLADELSSFVDLVFTANNHSYDFGEKGVERTIEILDEFGIAHIGTNLLPKIRRVYDNTINNHKLSFLNYTQFLNETKNDPIFKGVNAPETQPGLINFYSEAKVKETVNLAKERSEIVVVGVHQSYTKSNARELSRNSTREQREFLASISNLGVDVVIGGHPHYFQGAELLDDGKIIVYSLGNFFSTMNSPEYKINCGCIMAMNCDSFTNINYTFLPIATVQNSKNEHYFVIPLAPLEGGNYDWVTEEQRKILLGELENIRKTLRTCSLIEEEIPVQFL